MDMKLDHSTWDATLPGCMPVKLDQIVTELATELMNKARF